MSIKYMFKYVNKSHNRVTAAFYERRNIDGCTEIRDEIKMYYDCRYLSACETMWRCYEDIRKVADYVYPTFRDVCYVLGLLDDDKEYMDAIREVNAWASGDYIRRLFAIMLLSNSLSRPEQVWQSCCSGVAEGIAYREQWLNKNLDLSISGESLMNYALTKVEKILQSNGKSLRNYVPMPFSIEFAVEDNINILVLDELDYDGLKWVDKPFGGKVVVLRGDFRQILPIVLKASRQDIVHAMLNSSSLWYFCRVMKLSKNIRLQSCSSPSNVDEVIEFGDWILKVGNGNVREQYDGEASLEIPEDMLIDDSEDLFRDLPNFVYPDLLSNMYDPDYFQGRAIIAPTNERVESVNDHLMSLFPGEEKVYLSSDIQGRCTSYVNKKHQSSRGLCNGTRLQIIIIGIHVLHCKLLSDKNIGDIVFVPQMTLIPSNFGLSIKFQRRQFSLIVSFAMTINKSQCQTLSHVGLYLPRPVLSYDQLYIALSRVKSRCAIKIVIKWDSDELTDVTRNAVYKEVFYRI
ncbi:hypothetical protein ABFS83_09G058500 [Erythranthe nasuta]